MSSRYPGFNTPNTANSNSANSMVSPKGKKLTTATGLSIVGMAQSMRRADPSLSYKDAVKRAKPVVKENKKLQKKLEDARDTLDKGGSALRRGVFTKLFGNNLGNKLAKLTISDTAKEKASSFLLNKEKDKSNTSVVLQKAQKIQNTKLDAILKAVEKLALEVKTIKTPATKIAAPVTNTPIQKVIANTAPPQTNTTPIQPLLPQASMKPVIRAPTYVPPEAPPEPPKKLTAQNLKAVKRSVIKFTGYDESTVNDLMKDAPPGLTEEELLTYILSGKKQLPQKKAEKIPNAQVPDAIDAAKFKVMNSDGENQYRFRIKPAKPLEFGKPDIKYSTSANNTPSATTASMYDKTVPLQNVNKISDSQAEIKEAQKDENVKNAEAKRDKEEQGIMDMLTDIKKHLKTGGFMALIGSLLGSLGKGVLSILEKGVTTIGPLLLKFLGPAIGVIAAGYLGYKAGQYVAGKIDQGVAKLTGGKELTLGGEIYSLTHKSQDKVSEDLAQKAGTPKSEQEAIAKGKSSWIDPVNPNEYHIVPKDKRVGPAYAMASQQAANTAAAQVAPQVAPDTSTRVQPTPPSQSDQASQPIINNDNRTFVTQPSGGGDQTTIIQTRNDENSVMTYVASIFDHPVVHPGIFGM